MTESTHRPPPAPVQSSTVVAEPATPAACATDWAQREREVPGQVTATFHTHGRQS